MRFAGPPIILGAMFLSSCSTDPGLRDFCQPAAIKAEELRSKAVLLCASPHGCAISPTACSRGFRFDMKDSAPGAPLLNKAISQSEREFEGTITADITGHLQGTVSSDFGGDPVPVFLVTSVHSAAWEPMFTAQEKRRLREMGIPDRAEDIYPQAAKRP